MPETEDVTASTQPDPPEITQEVDLSKLQAITGMLNSKNPLMGLAALFLVGGGGGALSGAFVSPYIATAIGEHEDDEKAHAGLVAKIARLDEKIDDLETDVDASTKELTDISKGIAVALSRLEDR